ncbi:MAG: aconitate hydratase AcnA [Gammaproteobacteria bacterium]|nr:aconitate hydratase AcnA [Gammaproteobacteria bacterium]
MIFGGRSRRVVDLRAAAGDSFAQLPCILRILLENVVRCGGRDAAQAIHAIRDWVVTGTSEADIPFQPARILMHDTTCGPALVDIAAMRSALAEAGGEPRRLNPVLPIDISTDHSIAVDAFGSPDALAYNMRREMERNAERYRLMKWATKALAGVRVHPPGTGIMHTLNLERLATVVGLTERDGDTWAIPDTVLGTDSHTPMINGIGVLGWGVGGLEAESVCFGMPAVIRVPDIIGVRLSGQLRSGVTATDLALTLCERLRRLELADRFVEFFGPGVAALTAGERAVVANMAPEFGASCAFFPVDGQTLRYLRETGRSAERVRLVEDYSRHQGLWLDPAATPRCTDVLHFALERVGTSLAGPRRPQDRIEPGDARAALAPLLSGRDLSHTATQPGDGAVAVAAITSCTNTSDPRLLIAAGLLARKARELGLAPAGWVKTSLAPGSPTAARYLQRAGLMADLEALGFGIVGFGCTTCIGNSGPLTPPIESAIGDRGIVPVAVLSGNRNFPGRVHPQLEAAFLASPPLVVAFALAGDVNRNILTDPLGHTPAGAPVRLADIWPSGSEVDAALALAVEPNDYLEAYERAEQSANWEALAAAESALFPWDEASTYLRRPPFAAFGATTRLGSYRARPLLVLGDDITTDHISPAGAIPARSAAADYLAARGEDRQDLNVFAARRGNWEVMIRGLFTNRSVRNLLGSDIPPGSTIHAGSGDELPLWRAAKRYAADGTPLVIVAGERYGMGSSRDWAAKGVALLGVRAVLALGFERIHRSNLIGMGVVPLRLPTEWSPTRLGLTPDDAIEIDASVELIKPRGQIRVCIHRKGARIAFDATLAVETSSEVELLVAGGILPLILARALFKEV